MIHDFAKSPRVHPMPSPAARSRRVNARRLPKGRWLLVLAIVVLVVYWRTQASAQLPGVEFEPGVTESLEYQQAMEQQVEEENSKAREKEATETARRVQQQQQVAALKAKLQQQALSTEPEFGFYETLPESAWRVPVQRGIYVTEEDRKRASQRYMLQAASVRDFGEAQRLVQKLRQLGLQAFYSQDTDGTWYRVNVGPFDNVSKMNKAEDILVSLRMMPLKRKI